MAPRQKLRRSGMRLALRQIGFFAAACMAAAASASFAADSPVTRRPDNWAAALDAVAGLPNLHRVDAHLYRSAQPLGDGFLRLGNGVALTDGDEPIRSVINLRAYHDDTKLLPENSGLSLQRISFKTWHPEDEDVVAFLRMVTTPALQPVLVHCQHGSDRTGTMVAIYRIAVQGWSKRAAIDEMVNGGFGYHVMWKNLVRYIDALNIDAIKAEVARQGPWR